ncbi:hypothetical protein WJX81_006946 [Elliptochloris bilobata]|uniref:MYND-type domain-containing protein n=1 Tax=Elliptochloris bilobata TaxID=381761 RepID=A0AAW1R2F2_9CHLO
MWWMSSGEARIAYSERSTRVSKLKLYKLAGDVTGSVINYATAAALHGEAFPGESVYLLARTLRFTQQILRLADRAPAGAWRLSGDEAHVLFREYVPSSARLVAMVMRQSSVLTPDRVSAYESCCRQQGPVHLGDLLQGVPEDLPRLKMLGGGEATADAGVADAHLEGLTSVTMAEQVATVLDGTGSGERVMLARTLALLLDARWATQDLGSACVDGSELGAHMEAADVALGCLAAYSFATSHAACARFSGDAADADAVAPGCAGGARQGGAGALASGAAGELQDMYIEQPAMWLTQLYDVLVAAMLANLPLNCKQAAAVLSHAATRLAVEQPDPAAAEGASAASDSLETLRLLDPALMSDCWNYRCSNYASVTEQDVKLLVCSGCRTARYCTPACQSSVWKHEHRTAAGLSALRAAEVLDLITLIGWLPLGTGIRLAFWNE